MKRWVIFLVALLFSASIWADSSMLKMQISGPIKNTYYLCLNNMGCINIEQAKDKILPLQTGNIVVISVIDTASSRIHPQTLPTSCKLLINNSKKMITVSGKITMDRQGSIIMSGLSCSSS